MRIINNQNSKNLKDMKIYLRDMKRWAENQLPENSALRQTILVQDETISAEEFLVLSRTWMQLSKRE